MFAQFTSGMDVHAKALVLRAERQRVIASNIANADTPGYVARDINFKDALTQMTQSGGQQLAGSGAGAKFNGAATTTHARHIAAAGTSSSQLSGSSMAYATQSQPSVDGNSVDLDRERASFVDNSVRYETTLRFINGSAKGILSAIQGQ